MIFGGRLVIYCCNRFNAPFFSTALRRSPELEDTRPVKCTRYLTMPSSELGVSYLRVLKGGKVKFAIEPTQN
jgi:hypothetical protein